MEGEIVVFKADVCLRAFWHCRRKKKYSQSKGFKESQSLLSLFCTLYSSWCFAVAWSTMTTYNFFFLCTSAKHTPHTWQLFRSPLPKSQDRPWVPQLLVNVDGKRHKEQSRFLDHMPYKRSGLLVGKDGKERASWSQVLSQVEAAVGGLRSRRGMWRGRVPGQGSVALRGWRVAAT